MRRLTGTVKACHHCGGELTVGTRVARTDSCPHCYADLKCCRNCRFFEPAVNNQCRETAAEWTPEKEKANFCEFFEFAQGPAPGSRGYGASASGSDAARAAFDSLFKK